MQTFKGFTHEYSEGDTCQWYTPPSIFKALKIEFDLDPCSPGKIYVPWIPARNHYTTTEDGLLQPWTGNCWVNPPYGRDIWKWLKKLNDHGQGIALVFSRTETDWFQNYALNAHALLFVRHRIKFIHGKNRNGGTPGTGSVLLAWGAANVEALRFSNLGAFIYNH